VASHRHHRPLGTDGCDDDMTHSPTLRVARPTNHVAALAEMYTAGLGFSVLAEFADHDGFDGCILGNPDASYHLEFTSERGCTAVAAPSKDHLLVFYIADRDVWEHRCARMIAAGFRHVGSHNPYWDAAGRTFEDLDGYRVVLQNERWCL
jgi:YycE-like protein